MSSIIRRRRGLMGLSVMGVLPELGLNTQSSDSSPRAVTALLIAPRTTLARSALPRERFSPSTLSGHSGLRRRAAGSAPYPTFPSGDLLRRAAGDRHSLRRQ